LLSNDAHDTYHFRLATRPWPSAGGHHEY